MSIVYQGVTIDEVELGMTGKVELDDDQTELATLGQTVVFTGRGRIIRHSPQIGGQNTKPRLIATLSLDVLDSIEQTDSLPGQMKLGEAPAPTPGDAE